MQIKKLLVIADKGEKEQIAMARAAELAEQLGASIHLLAYIYEDSVDDHLLGDQLTSEIKQSLLKQREELAQQLTKQYQSAKVAVTHEVIWKKHISSSILDICENNQFDLVIKSANKKHTGFYAPTDWALLRDCEAPVLLVIDSSWPKRGRIIGAIDLAEEDVMHKSLNDKVLETTQYLSERMAMEPHAAFSFNVPTVLSELDIIDTASYKHQHEDKYLPKMQAQASQYQIPPDNAHVLAGKPGKAIPSLADKIKANMVVIGTCARSGISGFFLGNTAEKMLRRLNCDVLIVRNPR